MNFIFFYQNEFQDGKLIVALASRINHLKSYHQLEKKIVRSCCIQGQGSATFIVDEISTDRITGSLLEPLRSLPRLPVNLIVGLARPQTIKKIVQLAVSTGIKKLTLFQGELVEPSYRQSKVLVPENLESEAIKALEQTGDSSWPEIKVCNSLSIALSNLDGKLLVATDTAQNGLGVYYEKNLFRSSSIVIGPEKGFSTSELDLLAKHEAHFFSLGERVLRVETAASLALGQVLLLLNPKL